MKPVNIKKRNIYSQYITQENRWLALGISFLTGLRLLSEFLARVNYELSGPYNWDTSLYWAVGRGLLNGLPLYKAMFENKPPGIFLISALSLLCKSDLLVGNILQVFVLCLIALSPVLYLIVSGLQAKRPYSIVYYFMAVTFGLLIGLYTAERSGEIQVESFGAAFICMYIVILANVGKQNRKKSGSYVYFLVWSSFFLFLGTGMKEPFLGTGLAVAIILCNSVKELNKYFFSPLLIALIAGVLVLSITGLFTPYSSIYLPFMFEKHITANGSPLSRSWEYWRVFDDLNAYTSPLGILIFVLAGFYLVTEFLKIKDKTNFNSIFIIFFKFLLVTFLTLFSVGVGGQFFNHHFIFAIPVYVGFFVYFIKNIKIFTSYTQKLATVFVLLFIGLCTLLLPEMKYKERTAELWEEKKILKAEAVYLDEVLNTKKQDRYLFLGRNGPHLYMYTTHSPLGPLFFQYPEWVDSNYYGFKDKLLNNLYSTDIIVFDAFFVGEIENYIRDYILKNFTLNPWPEVSHIERMEYRYQIFFRNTVSSDEPRKNE